MVTNTIQCSYIRSIYSVIGITCDLLYISIPILISVKTAAHSRVFSIIMYMNLYL